MKVINDRSHIELRRKLRKECSSIELMLWQKLKRDQLGFPCRRQTSIAKYVVDFVFPARRLIIELDGVQHEEQQEYDNERDALLASLGYRVIRFQNHEVIQGIDKVLERISQELQST